MIRMGNDARTGEPVYIGDGHLSVFGKTGSGKSSLVADRLTRANIFSDNTFLKFDGGQDPAQFNQTLLHCHAAKRPLALLSDRPELRNSKIDPFRAAGKMSLIDAVNMVVASAGIDSSLSYGPFYFWIASVQGLLTVWRAMERRGIPIAFDTTVDFINNQPRRKGGKDDTEQLKHVISLMLEFRHVIRMDVDPSELGFVRWREIEESATVVYVAFEQMDATSVLFATMVLQSFLAYKRASTVRGQNDFDTRILMDEFQRMVSKAFAENMTGMRKHRTLFSLLAQSESQLQAVSKELSETLLGQIGIQIFFSPETMKEAEYIQQFSEEVIRRLGSTTRSFINPNTGERDYVTRRLTFNEIRAAAQTPNCAILVNRLKQGVEEPRIIYLEHLVSQDVHEYLSTLPFPMKLTPPPSPKPLPVKIADPAPQMDILFKQVSGWLAGD